MNDSHKPGHSRVKAHQDNPPQPQRRIKWGKVLIGFFYPLWFPVLVIFFVEKLDVCIVRNELVLFLVLLSMPIVVIRTLQHVFGFPTVILAVLVFGLPLAALAFFFFWAAGVAGFGP